MELVKIYPLYIGVACNYRRFAQRFQRLGINGYNGEGRYMANKQTNVQNKNKTSRHDEKFDHCFYISIYPLINYLIVFIEEKGINSWSNLWMDFRKPQRLRGFCDAQ